MDNVIKIEKPFFGSADFIATARLAVLDVVRSQLDPTDNVEIGIDDVGYTRIHIRKSESNDFYNSPGR